MQDTGRSPLHLLLDDRASRDGACGSDRRRRARGPARRPRTLRRQEDQGRPGKEGVSPRPGDASATSCANRACGRVRARTVRTAQDAGRRGQAREPVGPAGLTAAPRTHPAGDLTYVRVGGDWAYVCLLVGLADRGIVGHSAGRTRCLWSNKRVQRHHQI